MKIEELKSLQESGEVRVFRGMFGGRPEGLRGRVTMVGAPASPNIVHVTSEDGNTRRNWDRRTMSIV